MMWKVILFGDVNDHYAVYTYFDIIQSSEFVYVGILIEASTVKTNFW